MGTRTHGFGYESLYAHLYKYNVRQGQKVKRGDLIGFVGSTGLATGPHVCYRFWKNGKQVDHLREDFPSAEPIKEDNKSRFEQEKEMWMKKLDSIQLEKEKHLMASQS